MQFCKIHRSLQLYIYHISITVQQFVEEHLSESEREGKSKIGNVNEREGEIEIESRVKNALLSCLCEH